MSTATEVGSTLVERMGLKTLVESCLVLEEGVASAKDIEIGMMMGAGILPGPFTRADEAGLDTVLEQLERAQPSGATPFEPPVLLRRLVAQGRLGKKSRPGLLPLPAARRRRPARDRPARDPRRHRDRLAQPAAGEPAVAAGGARPDLGLGAGRGQARERW